MYLYRTDADALLRAASESLAVELQGLNESLAQLLEGDDWAFVIKAQAILEAALTDLVVAKIDTVALRSMVERLPLASEEAGKLRLAKDLDLVEPSRRACIRRLAALRNQLAHGTAHLQFTFGEYFAGLERSHVVSWRDALLWFAQDPDTKRSWTTIFSRHPRAAVWMSVFLIVADMKIGTSELATDKSIDTLARETTHALLREIQHHAPGRKRAGVPARSKRDMRS